MKGASDETDGGKQVARYSKTENVRASPDIVSFELLKNVECFMVLFGTVTLFKCKVRNCDAYIIS